MLESLEQGGPSGFSEYLKDLLVFGNLKDLLENLKDLLENLKDLLALKNLKDRADGSKNH